MKAKKPKAKRISAIKKPRPTYIALDTETGGLGSKVALLEVYCEIYDEKFKKLGEIEAKLRPDDNMYVVTAEALNINGIDLVEHQKSAITYKAFGEQLYGWLREWSNNGQNKLIPIGQNVKFDIIKITDNVINPRTWNQFVSYRVLDTATISQFLRVVGVIPPDVKGSLDSLRKFFKIRARGKMHSARTDTKVTVKVLQKMIECTAALNLPPNRP